MMEHFVNHTVKYLTLILHFFQVKNVIKFAEKVCLQRDKLLEERKVAISTLSNRYNVGGMVDLAVERIVHQWVRDMLECKHKIGDLDRHIRELSNEIKTLEMIGPYQIKRRNRTIEELEAHLDKKNFQENHLETAVNELISKNEVLKKQQGIYKKQIGNLYTDRRLQYIYSRENKKMPGKRYKPQIRPYTSDSYYYRQRLDLQKKKTVPKSPRSSPRPIKPDAGTSPRASKSPRGVKSPQLLNTQTISLDMGTSSNPAKVQSPKKSGVPKKRKRNPMPTMYKTIPEDSVPYSKVQTKSAKRFSDESFNVTSTEKKMSNLKV